MSAHIQFHLTDHTIDIAALTADLHDPAAGAEVSFNGRVRNHNDGHAVSRMEYQAYPALALATGEKYWRKKLTVTAFYEHLPCITPVR